MGEQVDRLISDGYRELNRKLHSTSREWGSYGARHVSEVRLLMRICGSTDILDYGCGKRGLEVALGMQIQNYDPAVPDCATDPRPADIVVCADVLEHVEPESINAVVAHIASKTRRVCFFEVATRPAHKFLADGRNAHLIIENAKWWSGVLTQHFDLLGPAHGEHGTVRAFALPKISRR